MKRDRMSLVADGIAMNRSIVAAAKAAGVSVASVFAWLKSSKEGDPRYIFSWQDRDAPFHEHCNTARQMGIALLQSVALNLATEGFKEASVFQGQLQYAIDPKLVGVPDDQLFMLYGVYDRYKRNEQGEVQPLLIQRAPNTQLITKLLGDFMPKQHGEHSSVEVNYGGIVRLERKGEAAAPKVIEHNSTEAFLPQGGDEAAEIEERPALAVGRSATSSAEFDDWAAQGEFAPPPVTYTKADGSRAVRMETPDPLLSDEQRAEIEAQQAETIAAATLPDGTPTQPNPLVDHDAGRSAFAAELAALEARKAELLNHPPAAPPQVQIFGRGDDGPPEKVGVSGQPSTPAAPATNKMERAAIMVNDIRARAAVGSANARERQALDAFDQIAANPAHANARNIRISLFESLGLTGVEVDHVGVGKPGKGAVAVVTEKPYRPPHVPMAGVERQPPRKGGEGPRRIVV